jgi:hypothetical protein
MRIELVGLDPEDAYVMAIRLATGSRRKTDLSDFIEE